MKRHGIGRVDRNASQSAEAGRDAVDYFSAGEAPIDEVSGSSDSLARRCSYTYRRTRGNRLNCLERQMVTVELDPVQNCDQSGRTGFAKGGPF